MLRLLRPLIPALVCSLLLGSLPAHAQSALEQVDPDAAALRRQPPPPPKVAPTAQVEPAAQVAPPAHAAPAAQVAPATEPESKDTLPARAGKKADPPVPAVVGGPAAAKSPSLRPIRIPTEGDAELVKAFRAWKEAVAGHLPSEAEKAQQKLVSMKQDLGITDLEAFSIALARASAERLKAGDQVEALTFAQTAAELSPDLPWAHLALARASFRSDPSEVGRWGSALVDAVRAFAGDPRFSRPALGDFLAALLAAFMATSVAVVCVFFLRMARYFFHDFHHLFPRAASRWQTSALAVLLLALPVVFRMGALPVLIVLAASVTLYLSWSERILSAAALLVLALSPLAVEGAVYATSFAGTPAEDVHQLEEGGLDAESAGQRVRARMTRGAESFEELFALGRYELRRGHLDSAGELFKKAAPFRNDDARLLTHLGNARFAVGDLEGAQAMYTQASASDSLLAAPLYNLSRLHHRRASALLDAAAARELEKAQTTESAAQDLDPSLFTRPEPQKDEPPRLNRFLVHPGLTRSEVSALAAVSDAGRRVADQLSSFMLGAPIGPLSLAVPCLAILGLVGFGALRSTLVSSRVCSRCGRSVCRRCDPELQVLSAHCGQCVNVYFRKGLVEPQTRVRKMLEVDRYKARTERTSWILGIVCSGAGHLFSGAPLRGVLFAFSSTFLIALALLRHGVLRAPWGEFPLWVRLVPVGLALALCWSISLKSLRKAHTR